MQDNSVDCVISNCVLNLVPDKDRAFAEIYRIVKNNGGRLAISDIALKRELPTVMNDDIVAYVAGYVNCISGAIPVDEYKGKLEKAGFKQVEFVLKKADLNVWKESWNNAITDGNTTQENDKTQTTATGGCCGGGSGSGSGTSGCGVAGANTTQNTPQQGGGCCSLGSITDGTKAMTGITFTKEQCERMKQVVNKIDLNEFVGSYYIYAIK